DVSMNQIELSGAAVFNKEKMLGWLSPGETRGLMFFVEKVEFAIVTLPCPDQPDKQLSIEMKKQKFTVEPTYQNGKVKFAVKLTTTDELAESGCTRDLSEMREELEKQLADKLQSELVRVVEKAQKKYKVDFLKLGETFNNRYPAEWKDLRKDWEAEFVKAKVSVKVDAHINSSVLLQRATKTRKDLD
ncbi:MAG: Ger(x)C family spore germination C-terminal domain-containing protein, partial [Bacilli bacterium]